MAQFDEYDAIQLFEERARRVRHDFNIQREANHVIRICRLVEGMPLAVELAAGWLKTLTCKQVGDQIQRNLDILVSPARDTSQRHRSIRAVFDHSWNLLTEEQRTMFPRLSVFRGGFTLEAAESVAGATLWMLAGLVDKSLLHFDDGRYNIHELLRQYGEGKLAIAGGVDSAQDAHSAYFLDFLAERLPDVKGRRQREATLEIDADFENIRVAWLRGVDRKDATRLDAALDTLDIFSASLFTQYLLVYKQILSYALDHIDPSNDSRVRRAWFHIKRCYTYQTGLPSSNIKEFLEIAQAEDDLFEVAFYLYWLAINLNDHDDDVLTALDYFDKAVERYRTLPDPFALANCLFANSLIARFGGEIDKAIGAAKECYEIRQKIHDLHGEAWSIALKSILSDNDSEYESGMERSCQIFREIETYKGVSTIQMYRAAAAFYKGDFVNARLFAEEGVRLGRTSNYESGSGGNFPILAQLACIEGDYEWALRMCEECRMAIKTDSTRKLFMLIAEANANFGLGNYHAARQKHQDALNVFLKWHETRNMLTCLPVSALLADYDGQTIWATEILGLIFRYPNTRTGWLYKWDLITHLRSDLEHKLGAEVFEAAWECGIRMDLETTVRRILAGQPSPLLSNTPSQSLHEPLTKRELEVLRLLECGLNNPKIASKLIITVATVKVHISHIFGKLNVENRTQAVVRARELNLL